MLLIVTCQTVSKQTGTSSKARSLDRRSAGFWGTRYAEMGNFAIRSIERQKRVSGEEIGLGADHRLLLT